MIDMTIFRLDDLFSFAHELYRDDPSAEFMPALVVFKADQTMDLIKFPDFDERRFDVLHKLGYGYALEQETVLAAVFMAEFWIRDALQPNVGKQEAFIMLAKTTDQQYEIRIATIDRSNGNLILLNDGPDSVEDNLLAEFFTGYKLGQQTFSAHVN